MLSGATYVHQFSFVIKHKSGALNKMADALSRYSFLLTTMHTKLLAFDSFRELLVDDAYFGPILSEVTTGKWTNFVCVTGSSSKEISYVSPRVACDSKFLRSYMMRDIWEAIRHSRWYEILIFGLRCIWKVQSM